MGKSTKNISILTVLLGVCTFNGFCVDAEVDPYLQDYNFDIDKQYEEYQAEPEKIFQVIIDPLYRTQLSAEIQSPVEKIHKRMGEDFKKGEVLIQLDDIVYASNLKKAQAVLDRAQVEFDGKKQLYKYDVASLFELKEAEANVAIAQAEYAIAQRDLDATKLEAPYDGKVVTLGIEEHELPQKGAELIEIVYERTLLAKLLVPSSMLDSIKVGDPFKIKISEADQTIDATITRIGSVIDPSSMTVKIEAEVDNSEDYLRPGMSGTADFGEVAIEEVSPAEEEESDDLNIIPMVKKSFFDEIFDSKSDSDDTTKDSKEEIPEEKSESTWEFFNY